MTDYLPEDVLIEILVRATIKTLLRCTSVCKSWRSVITSPGFTEAHLNHQKTNRSLLIIRACPANSQKEVYSWHSDNVSSNEVGCNSPYDHPYNNYYRILESCNGVLCLVDDYPTYSEDTSLWNPAIRVWVKLPLQPVTRKPYNEIGHFTIFGVDPSSNDYKVIRVIYQKKGLKVAPKVLKYSLSSNSWENVSHLAGGFKDFITRRLTTQAYYNGASHCIVWDKIEQRPAVLLFHFGENVFHSMELPADVSVTCNTCFANLWPVVFHGLFSVLEIRRQAECTLWTMEQYRVGSSWVKRYSINFSKVCNRIIGFRKNGKFLIDRGGRLYEYDPEPKKGVGIDQQVYDLNILSSNGYYKNALHAFGFVESLALLGRQTDVLG